MPLNLSLERWLSPSPRARASALSAEPTIVTPACDGDRRGDGSDRDGDSLLPIGSNTHLPRGKAPPLLLPARRLVKSALPRDFYYILACVLGCAVAIFLGIFIPMVVLSRDAAATNTVLRTDELNAGTLWGDLLRATLIDGLVKVHALEGLVMSAFPKLPPFNATPDASGDYNVNSHFQRFSRLASLQASQEPAILVQAICPAGIITMAYPHDAALIGRNLLSPSDPSYNEYPTPMETITGGQQVIGGPRPSHIAAAQGTWIVLTRVPIYNKTLDEAPSLDNFWGFVLLSVNISGALAAIELDAQASQKQLDFILYDTNLTYNNSNVIASSLPSSTTQAEYNAFIADSTVTDVLSPRTSLLLAVLSQQTYASLTPDKIVNIVMWTLLGSLALLGAALAVMLWRRREYDAAAHAPKMAPFAMLTVGSLRAAELWDTAQDELLQVLNQGGPALNRLVSRHGAYPIPPQTPLTVSYVTRSVSSAVQMAFALIEDAASHPIDGPLRAALGEYANSLEVGCTVHWCTDAAVRVESLQGSYRYEGPDVAFGGRMWAFAAPSAVTVSAAVVERLPCHGLAGVKAHAYQTVDVMGRHLSAAASPSTGQSNLLKGSSAGGSLRAGSRHSGVDAQLHLLVPPNNASAAAAAARAIAIAEASAPSRMVDEARAASSAYLALANEGRERRTATAAVPAPPPAAASATAAVPMPQHVTAHAFVGACHAATTWDAAVPASSMPRHLPLRSAAVPRPPPEQRTFQSEPVDVEQDMEAGGGQPRPPPLSNVCVAPGLDRVVVRTSTSSTPPSTQTPMQRRHRVYVETDAVTRALLRPALPRALDVALRTAFDQHAVIVSITYDEVRPLVYYFYTSYSLLFRPLAGPERQNIFRRLVSAFGVPQHGVLEHLAARGAMQWLLQARRLYGITSRRPATSESGTGSGTGSGSGSGSGSRRTAWATPTASGAPSPSAGAHSHVPALTEHTGRAASRAS